MKYNIKKNKNLIISSSILAGINCNNIYCGCLCGDDKNKPNTGDGKEKKDETPNGGEGEKKLTPEENEEQKQKAINVLLNLFNDKKTKLEKKGELGELKITEEQIKNIKEKSQFQNIFNELNNIKIHNDPVKGVVLDVDNIHNETHIVKLSELGKGETNAINFYKFINDDIFENNDDKIVEVMENLFKENKLFHFIKYDQLMFNEDEDKRNEYLCNNTYLLYIDKKTFNINDCVNLGEITFANFKSKIGLNPIIFKNCYLLYTSLENEEDKITIFKKNKLIIDLDHLENYPNIFHIYIYNNLGSKVVGDFKRFLKERYKVEINNIDDLSSRYNNSIEFQIGCDYNYRIFDYDIDEIEFKGYKKSTIKPADYSTIDATKKFEINIKDSKGNITIYYFVKEKTK